MGYQTSMGSDASAEERRCRQIGDSRRCKPLHGTGSAAQRRFVQEAPLHDALLLQRQYWTRRTPLSDAFGYWRRYLRGGVPGVRSVWARNSTSAGSRLGGHVASRIGRRSPSSTTRHERICAPDSSSVSRISSSILGHPGSLEYRSGLLRCEDHAPTTLSLSGSCE